MNVAIASYVVGMAGMLVGILSRTSVLWRMRSPSRAGQP